jgi:transcriptional regulator of nitric oxide reductase
MSVHPVPTGARTGSTCPAGTPRRPPAALAALAFSLACGLAVSGQVPTARTMAYLKALFPEATSFSSKEGDPPHIKAFIPDAKTGQPVLSGLAFWTTELEPLERGYDGPIKMIVGLSTKGTLNGVIVVEQHEPFGPISVLKPRFSEQFKGKSVRDPFVVGEDVDAVSTATITITSATRAIKKSARRVASRLLTPEGASR